MVKARRQQQRPLSQRATICTHLGASGTRLFAKADGFPEAGRMAVDLPAIPGRKARKAQLSLRFATVEIARPVRRKRGEAELPRTVTLQFVDAREIDPPQGQEAAHWRLLTTHKIEDIAAAQRIVGFYRKRWTIEQVFRTMKTRGFQIEALRQQDGPLQKLVTAILIAAIVTMQLVAERDGAAARPLQDALDPKDGPLLEQVCKSLEGNTQKQKKPHPKRLSRLCCMGVRKAWRPDRLLRQAWSYRHAEGLDPIPSHQTWMGPPKCVNLVA